MMTPIDTAGRATPLLQRATRRATRPISLSFAARVMLSAACLLGTAYADDDEGERERAPRTPVLAAYQQECGACHVAYPAGLLPAESWKRVIGGLQHHYGTDASLDAATAKTLSAWLVRNAGTSRRVSEAPPEDRITRSGWFVREHDEVPAAAWKRASIKSPARCAACHTNAEKGDFNEHDIRIPR
jgi:mono/diheme cytochrome c family protein